MQINSISNQVFQAKKFQLPINEISTRWWYKKVNCAKVYDNPNAETLYKKAQQTEDLKEKAELLYQMGDYRLIDAQKESIINKFLNSVIK